MPPKAPLSPWNWLLRSPLTVGTKHFEDQNPPVSPLFGKLPVSPLKGSWNGTSWLHDPPIPPASPLHLYPRSFGWPLGVLCDLIHLSTWLAWLSRPKVCKFPWTTSSHRASEETRGQERLVPWEKRHLSCLRLCGCWESKWFKHAVCFGTFSPQDGFVNNVSIHRSKVQIISFMEIWVSHSPRLRQSASKFKMPMANRSKVESTEVALDLITLWSPSKNPVVYKGLWVVVFF